MNQKLWCGAGFVMLCIAVASWSLVEMRTEPGTATRTPTGSDAETIRLPAHQEGDRRRPEKRDRQAVSAAAQRWYEELLERYPQFQVEFKEVPDDENGFLQFLNFADGTSGFGDSLDLPDKLADMVAGKTPWDPAELSAWLDDNRELVDILTRLLSLEESSAEGIPLERFPPIPGGMRLARDIPTLFHGMARLEIESGRVDAALSHYRRIANLANFFDGIEIVPLYSKTVAVLIRSNSQSAFRQSILPHVIDDPAALAEWRELLVHPQSSFDAAPSAFAGEWHSVVRNSLLPGLIEGADTWPGEGDRRVAIPDPQALLDGYTARAIWQIQQLETAAPSDVAAGKLPRFEQPSGPSEQSLGILQVLEVSHANWSKGLIRCDIENAMFGAMLAILAGEDPGLEPISGKPFMWDPETRTLSPPSEVVEWNLGGTPIIVPAP